MKITTTSIIHDRRLARQLRPLLPQLDDWVKSLGAFPISNPEFKEISIWFSDRLGEAELKHHLLDDSNVYSIQVGVSHVDLCELKKALVFAVKHFPFRPDDMVLVAAHFRAATEDWAG